MSDGAVVIIGGTSGICGGLAAAYAARGRTVVVTGRDAERAAAAAATLEGSAEHGSCAFDISHPEEIAPALEWLGPVDRLILGAIERDENTVADYNLERALKLVTLKLVGYTEVVHALRTRLTANASILLFGGLALRRPYPGSTTVTTVNGGVTGIVRTLAVELAPITVNAIHPGIVGDTPYWAAKPEGALDPVIARTPIGRLATTAELVDASLFLLENGAVNGVNLEVDGGWLLT